MLVAGGSTNVTTYFVMRLAADGTGATGLTPADFDLQYTRSGAAAATKVDASLNGNGVGGAHSDSTVIEVDATSSPGLYRVDWVDAAFAAAVREVILSVKVATAFTEYLRVEIDGEVNVVEWAGTDVVAGAIPAAAADGIGGLPISDAGGLEMDNIHTAVVTDIPATISALDSSVTDVQTTVDVIETATVTDIPATIATAQANLDTITGAAGVVIDDSTANDTMLSDAIWDETLTGSNHNVATSAGRRLRQLEEAFVMAEGVIATQTDGRTCTLDSGAVGTADYYLHARLQLEEGTGAGQSRIIVAYSAGKVCLLDSNWVTNPDTSTRYSVVAADVHTAVSDMDLAEGIVATYTNTTTITLDSGAVATTDYYLGELITFTHGDGKGQTREITGYTSGRVVTMAPALVTAVAAGTVWHIQAAVSVPEIVDEVWDELQSAHTGAGTMGEIATETASILVDTAEIGTAGAGLTDLGGMSTGMKAEVNVEAKDVLVTDTLAELAAVPAANASISAKVNWLFLLARNKVTQTATTKLVKADDTTTTVGTSTVSADGTTATRGEFS